MDLQVYTQMNEWNATLSVACRTCCNHVCQTSPHEEASVGLHLHAQQQHVRVLRPPQLHARHAGDQRAAVNPTQPRHQP